MCSRYPLSQEDGKLCLQLKMSLWSQQATKEAIWLRRLLIKIDTQKCITPDSRHISKWGLEPALLQVDNTGAIDLATNPKHHDRTKHIDIRYHFIREAIERGLVDLIQIPSTEQMADIFTKPLGWQKFEEHREGMGVVVVGNWGSTLPAPP